MNGLLIDQRGDGREISEAMVNGLIINGQIDEALVVIDAWKQTFPTDGHPIYFEGRIAEYDERDLDAQAKYRSALQQDPDHRPALYRLGRILLRLKQPDEALGVFQNMLSKAGGAAAALGAAQSARESGKGGEAKSYLVPLLQMSRQAFDRSLSAVDESPVEFCVEYELGKVEGELGNHAEALRLLEIAHQREPTHLEIRYARAVELRENGKIDEAAIEMAEVGRCRAEFTEVDAMIDHIRSAKMVGLLEEKYRVGDLYVRYGSKKTGEFWLKQVLLGSPDHQKAHRRLAELYEDLARERPQYRSLAEHHRQAVR